MNILLASPFYSQHWDSGHFWARAFSRLGHHLVLWDWRTDISPPDTKYDLAVVLKGDKNTPLRLHGPKVCYWPDELARDPEAEANLALYDKVFTMVVPTPANMVWLPGAWDEQVHQWHLWPEGLMWKTVFIGTYTPYKGEMLRGIKPDIIFGNGWPDSLDLANSVKHHPVYLHDYARLLSDARIAVNVHRRPEVGVTRRLFEFMACTFTITDRVPGVGEVLGSHLADQVSFTTADEANELIQHYLTNETERWEVWARERKAIADYTYTSLVKAILEEVHV